MQKRKRWTVDLLFITGGTVIYALGIYLFTVPNNIAPGGVTGILTVLNFLFGVPIGSGMTIINIPLLLVGLKWLGKDFLIKTFYSSVLFTVTIDYIFPFFPFYQGDKILAAVFGGVLIGVGLAFNFMRDGSTGGMDIINRLLQKKFPYIKLGFMTFLTDLVIISMSIFAFRDIETGLYAIIAMFVSAQLMDTMLYRLDDGNMILVTDRPWDISREINDKVRRGSTIVRCTGTFSGGEKYLLICAVRKNQFYKVKNVVKAVDPRAFFISTNASAVLGEGFNPIT